MPGSTRLKMSMILCVGGLPPVGSCSMEADLVITVTVAPHGVRVPAAGCCPTALAERSLGPWVVTRNP
jgi:hypothetical protein